MSRTYPTAEEAARVWSSRIGWTKESAIAGGWSELAGRLKQAGDIYQGGDGKWRLEPKGVRA